MLRMLFKMPMISFDFIWLYSKYSQNLIDSVWIQWIKIWWDLAASLYASLSICSASRQKLKSLPICFSPAGLSLSSEACYDSLCWWTSWHILAWSISSPISNVNLPFSSSLLASDPLSRAAAVSASIKACTNDAALTCALTKPDALTSALALRQSWDEVQHQVGGKMYII